MKRSESILVWAVTAIVGVIVLVAVIFGQQDDGKSTPEMRGKKDVQELIAGNLAGGNATAGSGEFIDANDKAGTKPVPDPATDPKPDPNAGDPKGASDPAAALRARVPEIRTLLGEFRLEGQPDGSKYRVVTVRFGDSFGELVQRWMGAAGAADEVLALNEGLVPERLRSGEELWFPWVDDQVLVDAFQARHGSTGRTGAEGGNLPPRPTGLELGAVANVGAGQPVPAAASASGEWRTVRPGESLWKLASDAVGQRRAQAYIDEIMRLNPAISDPGQIKAGDRVLMPRR